MKSIQLFFFVFFLITPLWANNDIDTLKNIEHSFITDNDNISSRVTPILNAYEKKDLLVKENLYVWILANILLFDQKVADTIMNDKERDGLLKELGDFNKEVDRYFYKAKLYTAKQDGVLSDMTNKMAKVSLYLFILNKNFISFGTHMYSSEFLRKYSLEKNPHNLQTYCDLAWFYLVTGDVRKRTNGIYTIAFKKAKYFSDYVIKRGEKDDLFMGYILSTYYYMTVKNNKKADEYLNKAKEMYPSSRYLTYVKKLNE